jgi:uncharacterized protein YfcZ (UPF0381/DUF406 family)
MEDYPCYIELAEILDFDETHKSRNNSEASVTKIQITKEELQEQLESLVGDMNRIKSENVKIQKTINTMVSITKLTCGIIVGMFGFMCIATYKIIIKKE